MIRPILMRPMRPDEFGPWRERFLKDWSEDLMRVEDLAPADASHEAARRLGGDLPDGLATAAQHLFVLSEGETIVGDVWWSTGHAGAFLEDLTIAPKARGRGIGKAALQLVEAELRERGLTFLDLHVYADNAPALALYRSAGYRTTGMKLRKSI